MADNWNALQYTNPFPVQALNALDSGLKTVLGLIEALESIIKLIQFFISAFGSLMGAINAFISLLQNELTQISSSLGSAGVFVNILIPPALVKNLSSAGDMSALENLSTGGFPGFLGRLKVSLYNDADRNRPVFGNDSLVGGLIFVADTETLDKFFQALDFIDSMFSFSELFPFNTKPPPPRNVRAYTGWFKQTDGSTKYGIKLAWDSPPMNAAWSYRVSRSRVDGGVLKVTYPIPDKLVGPTKNNPNIGLLNALSYRLYSGTNNWPPVQVYAYDDSVNTVTANIADGSGTFYDYNIDAENEAMYYYVIESGFPIFKLWGNRSPQVMAVTIPTNCINENKFAVVVHKNNQIEFISKGYGALGMWSSVQVNLVLPFLPLVVNTINNFLETLKGSLKTNTSSFLDFIQGIADKFKKYAEILDAIVQMIAALETFFSTVPEIMILNVPPAPGGTDNFINRVNNAKLPVKVSGPDGCTLGVCMIYGASYNNPLSGFQSPDIKTQMDTVGKAFSLISSILVK